MTNKARSKPATSYRGSKGPHRKNDDAAEEQQQPKLIVERAFMYLPTESGRMKKHPLQDIPTSVFMTNNNKQKLPRKFS